MSLKEKIESNSAIIGIIGIGYVGKCLGQLCYDQGFSVKGWDISASQVATVNEQTPIKASTTLEDITECDIFFITVETPIDDKNEPDISSLKKATTSVASILRSNQLVVIESTIAPGTVRDELLPILAASKKDFVLAYSPQRVDFGNKEFPLKVVPKVVAGVDDKALEMITLFYSKIIDHVVPVSSVETAEFCKLLENTFRYVNINLINELSEYASRRGIDIWETVKAASTKPYGYIFFYDVKRESPRF